MTAKKKESMQTRRHDYNICSKSKNYTPGVIYEPSNETKHTYSSNPYGFKGLDLYIRIDQAF